MKPLNLAVKRVHEALASVPLAASPKRSKYRGMHAGTGPAADIYDIVRDLDRRISELEGDRK